MAWGNAASRVRNKAGRKSSEVISSGENHRSRTRSSAAANSPAHQGRAVWEDQHSNRNLFRENAGRYGQNGFRQPKRGGQVPLSHRVLRRFPGAAPGQTSLGFNAATPRASAIVFTACRPAPARASATAGFFGWARSSASRRISFSVLQCLLAQQPLQLPHVALRGPVFGGRHSSPAPPPDCVPSAYSHRQRNSWFGAMPCRRATSDTDMPGPVRLLHDCCLLFRRPAPPRLNRRDHLNSVDRRSHRHRHTPGA